MSTSIRLSDQDRALFPKKELALFVLDLLNKGEELVKSPLELVGSYTQDSFYGTAVFVASEVGATTKKALTKAQSRWQDMQVNIRAQRFGKLHQNFGDFGELRKQKKAPNTEVFYFVVKVENEGQTVEVYRSLQNASSEQISSHIRMVGRHLEGGAITQQNAEIILDLCYAELNRRINK